MTNADIAGSLASIDKYALADHSTEDKKRLQEDAGIPHLPTNVTYEARMAVEGEGERAGDWADKPHRLIFDLCRTIEALEAYATTQSPVCDRNAVLEEAAKAFDVWPHLKEHAAAIRALKDAQPSSGWRLVPVEPTEAMIEAAERCDYEPERCWDNSKPASFSDIYRAMLAAAPGAPTP